MCESNYLSTNKDCRKCDSIPSILRILYQILAKAMQSLISNSQTTSPTLILTLEPAAPIPFSLVQQGTVIGCQPSGGTWRSPMITTDLLVTKIRPLGENGCFGKGTLWPVWCSG